MGNEETLGAKLKKLPIADTVGYTCSGVANLFARILQTFIMYYATESLGIAVATISC